MKDDAFLAKCKSIDPSAEVDFDKNLEAIKSRIRLLTQKEQTNMTKNKKIKRPVAVAALLAGIMVLSAAVYAAAPMIMRYFDTRIVQGDEFVTDFFVGEFDLPDGTTSVISGSIIDREALEAAGRRAIIAEVNGEQWVLLDELHLDSMEDGMALLQLDDALIPGYLPNGFSFSRFTFPVNPNNHQYISGNIRAAELARVYFSNEDGDVISINIGAMIDMHTLAVSHGQQGLLINGKWAALSGNTLLSSEQLAALEGVALFEGEVFDDSPWAVTAARNDGKPHLVVVYNDIVYSISSDSQYVTADDLVRIAASLTRN